MVFCPPGALPRGAPFMGGGPPAPLNAGLVCFLLVGFVFATCVRLPGVSFDPTRRPAQHKSEARTHPRPPQIRGAHTVSAAMLTHHPRHERPRANPRRARSKRCDVDPPPPPRTARHRTRRPSLRRRCPLPPYPSPVPNYNGGNFNGAVSFGYNVPNTPAPTNVPASAASAYTLPSPMFTRIGPGHMPVIDQPMPKRMPP